VKKILIHFAFAVPFLIFISCSQQKEKQVIYYPIDSLLNAQVNYLAEAKAKLSKDAEINGLKEAQSFTPADTTAWQHELDIFFALNTLNKPINLGSYTTVAAQPDSTSNLLINSFTTTEDLPVKYFNVYYLDNPSSIKKIVALYSEANSLLKESRLLTLDFKEVYNKNILSSYTILGGQKMFLGDSVQFSVRGTISLQ
jgi:hypothetical protein